MSDLVKYVNEALCGVHEPAESPIPCHAINSRSNDFYQLSSQIVDEH